MQSSQIEQTLRAMIEAERERAQAEENARPKGRLARLFARRTPKSEPATPVAAARAAAAKTGAARAVSVKPLARKVSPAKPRRTKSRRGDFIVAGLGLALGFGCAVFPWYIFFNQEKFGVQAMKFGGGGQQQAGPIYLGNQGERVGAPMSLQDIPPMQLDLFATGTPKRAPQEDPPPAVEDQPFPGDVVGYKLIYVSAGRAMIADDSGLWVVQPGSLLPDNSQVARIEQQSGKWVLVTSADRVVPLTPQ